MLKLTTAVVVVRCVLLTVKIKDMNWIDVKERTPKQVEWDNEVRSGCADVCYYYIEYSKITHWCKIPKEPNCK